MILIIVLSCERPTGQRSALDSTLPSPESGFSSWEDTGVEVAPTTDTGITYVTPLDTAGPPCAGTPGDTGLFVDIPVPDEACSLAALPRGVPGVSLLADEAYLARIHGHEGLTLGRSLAAIRDSDLDGVGEVAIGGAGSTDEWGVSQVPGEVWVFPGRSLHGDLRRSDARTTLKAVIDGEPLFGDAQFLVSADLTGDGVRDLIVDGTGYRYTYVLPLPLPRGQWEFESLASAVLRTPGGDIYDFPGVGDIDGDGYADLSLSGTGAGRLFHGGVTILRGPIVGMVDDPGDLASANYQSKALDASDELQRGQSSGRYTPAIVHDVTGDGLADVLMGGDRLADIRPPDPSDQSHGGFVLFEGSVQGEHTASDARAVIYGSCGARHGYYAYRVGDPSGDCGPDVAVGAASFRYPGEGDRGVVYVLSGLHRARGNVPMETLASAMIVGEQPGASLFASGYLGDIDRDGFDDLLVGDPSGGGAVYLFLGPVRGALSAGDANVAIYGSGGAFGFTVRGANDLNGDGVSDLMVGAHSADLTSPTSNDGMVYIFSGADLLAALP